VEGEPRNLWVVPLQRVRPWALDAAWHRCKERPTRLLVVNRRYQKIVCSILGSCNLGEVNLPHRTPPL
jgi:hypothetical protein